MSASHTKSTPDPFRDAYEKAVQAHSEACDERSRLQAMVNDADARVERLVALKVKTYNEMCGPPRERCLWPPAEMADLMDMLARSADRMTNSYSETAHLSRNAARSIRNLTLALEMMVTEKVDYMRINNLGDPETQHTIKAARAALSSDGGGNG